MIDERTEELAALHALDLLEGAERDQFKAAVATDPALARLVAELRAASATLAHVPPAAEPPATLRARLLASVDQSKIENPKSKILPFPTFLPWLAAAGFAIAAALLGQRHLSDTSQSSLLHDQITGTEIALQTARNETETTQILARRQLDRLTQQLTLAQTQLTDRDRQIAKLTGDLKTQGDLAHLKITALASMLKNSPAAIAVAVWDPQKQEGVLKVDKLPALAADQDYQLWVVDTDPARKDPVDGGVFTVDPQTGAAQIKFTGKQPVAGVAAFAVTRERKGGVPKAEGPFVLLGK